MSGGVVLAAKISHLADARVVGRKISDVSLELITSDLEIASRIGKGSTFCVILNLVDLL